MISFIKGSEYRQITRYQEQFQNKQPNGKLIYLLDPSYDFKIFELIPRTFEIASSNTSCKFNIKLLKDVSPAIRELLKKDPKARQFKFYSHDFSDGLSAIEQLFQGKMVF